MSFDKGDRVVITDGEFKGHLATVTDKRLIGEGLTVALADDGRQIETRESHVELANPDGIEVASGDRVIVTEGRLKGEVGTVLDTARIGQKVEVRLDDGKVIDTEQAHLALYRDR